MKRYVYTGILLGTLALTGCSVEEEATFSNVEEVGGIKHEKDKEQNKVIELTQEQKVAYYKQYKEIVDQVMQKKLGISMSVPPMNEFKDWVEPKEYKKTVQEYVDSFLKSEREALKAVGSNKKDAVLSEDGSGAMAKSVDLYISDIIFTVEVSGHFETQYDEAYGRQMFSKLSNLSSKLIDSHGTWKQTSYKAKLTDGGRKYLIHVEGVYDTSTGTGPIEKAFTVEFKCNKNGRIY
ncbi:hypothetical protein [Bacillus massiliigorillae]|uniref:hypothetical protein n=1 Tax=Bacillus massiliigorillae TaxID=1243664 RepID=UPI0003A2E2CF|nr:hypothetical protein [Bacillus massiliigorillae]